MLGMNQELQREMAIYVQKIRPHFANPDEDKIFVKDDGYGFKKGTIGRRLTEFFAKTGVTTQRVSHTKIRKFIATRTMEDATPKEDKEVAKMMGHSVTTQRRCYVRTRCTNLAANAMDIVECVTNPEYNKQKEKETGDEGKSMDKYEGEGKIIQSFNLSQTAVKQHILKSENAFFVCLFQNNLDQVPQDNQDQVLRSMMNVRTLVSAYDLLSFNGSLITVMTILYIENAFLFVYSRTIWNLDQVPQDNQDQVLRRMMVVRTLVSEYDLFTLNDSLITVMTVLYIENAFLFVYSRTIWTNTSGQSGPSTLENDGGKDTGEQV